MPNPFCFFPVAGKDTEPELPKQPDTDPEDKRQCALCLQYGDAPSKVRAYLLRCGEVESGTIHWILANSPSWRLGVDYNSTSGIRLRMEQRTGTDAILDEM